MKKENRKSTPWLMCGLAALMVLGSGSLAAAQTVTSYNDLAWGGVQLEGNTTKITSPNGGSVQPSFGQLLDFSTGNPTAVTLTVTGGLFDGDPSAMQGATPTMGDAFDIFDGKVDGLGVISYLNPDPGDTPLVLTFTNMDPNKVYDLTFFAHRDDYAWDRASLVTISGHDAFVNTSSIATDNPDTGTYPGGVLFTGPSSPSTRLPADNDNGYVARFNNIKSGSDGTVVLTISYNGNDPTDPFKGKYGSAIRLIESGKTLNTLGDVDGDGKDDILWRHTNGDVAWWLGNGLTLGQTGIIATGVDAAWTIRGAGDLSGDGKADIEWRHTNGDVAGWLGNGLTLGQTGIIATAVDAAWTIQGVGDLDGDGKDDFVWRHTNGDVAVWLGNGLTLGATGIIATAVDAAWTICGVGDLDGDGKDDIVWRHTNGDVAVWLGNGLTLGQTGIIATAVDAAWTIRGVGDVSGDGKADIEWRHTNGDVAVWLGNGLTLGATGIIATAVDAAWTIQGVGDVSGDGKDDFVWRHTNGDVAVWLGNGLTLGATGIIATAVDAAWSIQP